MPWAIAAGAGLGYLATREQAGAMEDATREQIGLQREQFDYARDLYEALLRQQGPRTETSQRALRSLSMMAGLGDPGTSPSIMEQLEGPQATLSDLRSQLSETDKFLTTGGRIEKRKAPVIPGRRSTYAQTEEVFVPEETKLNPEFQRLEEEIAALESELGGGEAAAGAEPFAGPRDITEMPGYQFAVDEGLEALSASGAARGMQLSGAQMEDITEFGQGTATKFRSQLLNELRSLAGFQPTQTVGNLAKTGVGEAQAVSPLLGQMGAIGAAETAGKYGNLGALLGQLDFGGGGAQRAATNAYIGSPAPGASFGPRTF